MPFAYVCEHSWRLWSREKENKETKKTPQVPASRLVKSRAARGFVVLVVVEGRPPVYVAEVRPERGGGDEGEAAQATQRWWSRARSSSCPSSGTTRWVRDVTTPLSVLFVLAVCPVCPPWSVSTITTNTNTTKANISTATTTHCVGAGGEAKTGRREVMGSKGARLEEKWRAGMKGKGENKMVLLRGYYMEGCERRIKSRNKGREQVDESCREMSGMGRVPTWTPAQRTIGMAS